MLRTSHFADKSGSLDYQELQSAKTFSWFPLALLPCEAASPLVTLQLQTALGGLQDIAERSLRQWGTRR
jgi:hypothetical protein